MVIPQQLGVRGGISFPGPHDFGSIDVGAIEDPFIQRVVTGSVADDGKLRSGELLEVGCNTRACDTFVCGALPGAGPPHAGPLRNL